GKGRPKKGRQEPLVLRVRPANRVRGEARLAPGSECARRGQTSTAEKRFQPRKGSSREKVPQPRKAEKRFQEPFLGELFNRRQPMGEVFHERLTGAAGNIRLIA